MRRFWILAPMCMAVAAGACSLDGAAAQRDPAPAASPAAPEQASSVLAPGAARCGEDLADLGPRSPAVGARIASWNVRWFPRGRSRGEGEGTDISWLACVIAQSDLDLVAVQEFVQNPAGRRGTLDLLAALGQLTGALWHARFDECPDDGRQHVGFLYREDRVVLDDVRTLGEVNPAGGPCAHLLRPGLFASARFASGTRLSLLTVHLDSGTAARDRDNRSRSVEVLARFARERTQAEARARGPLVVLGDWNTMGCRACEAPHDGDAELASHMEVLGRGPRPLRRLAPPHDCSAFYRNRPVVLDHVFAMPGVDPGASVSVGGACERTACGRLEVADRVVLDALSDHCPLILTVPAGGRGAAAP